MTDSKVREVQPDVYLVHLPLPMRPSIVNVYLLRSGDEWVLVDTGLSSDESRAAFMAALREVGCRPERLRTIICTHHHPDHFGASQPYRELGAATVYLNQREYESSKSYVPQRRNEAVMEFFIRHGIPLSRFVHIPSPAEVWGSMYAPAVPDCFIDDGDVIRVGDLALEVVATPGHTSGHCVLYLRAQRLMIVGDHLLPKITPHVGVFPGGPSNPLASFLASQRKIREIDVDLVLPAHGGVFRDHRHRAGQIIAHHQYRLQEMLDAVRPQARTAYDVARVAFGFDLDASLAVQFPATFEALAHLAYLEADGQVVREERDERVWYRAR